MDFLMIIAAQYGKDSLFLQVVFSIVFKKSRKNIISLYFIGGLFSNCYNSSQIF
jgi:hypothetical protein